MLNIGIIVVAYSQSHVDITRTDVESRVAHVIDAVPFSPPVILSSRPL